MREPIESFRHFTRILTRFEEELRPVTAVARDALIDLLNQSATTFSWRLMCLISAQGCALNLRAIEVAVTDSLGKPVIDSQGKPEKRGVWFDRCRDCAPATDPLTR
jgi:hypothetical protein